MGMMNSDDEQKIAEDAALKEWLESVPSGPNYDASREDREAHLEKLKEWYKDKPDTRNPYENERR